jgi:hypothetical protein
MPKVGGKSYSYDAKGMAQAKAASQRMANTTRKRSGGTKGFNGTPKPQTRKG